MRRARMKLGLLGGLLAALVGTMGCLRTTQMFTIYPDGSGKADIEITLMGMMAEAVKTGQMGGQGQQPIDMVKESLKGKVYWSNLVAKEGDAGTYVLKGTGYFENVADLQMENGGIKFGPEGTGHKLWMQQEAQLPGGEMGMPGGDESQMTPEEKAQAEQMKAMMKGMLAGFSMEIRVKMPGEVSTLEGFREKSGREAWIKIDDQELTKMIDENKKPPSQMSVISGAPGDLAAELAAFKKELAAAKAAAPPAEKEEPGSEDEGDEGNF